MRALFRLQGPLGLGLTPRKLWPKTLAHWILRLLLGFVLCLGSCRRRRSRARTIESVQQKGVHHQLLAHSSDHSHHDHHQARPIPLAPLSSSPARLSFRLWPLGFSVHKRADSLLHDRSSGSQQVSNALEPMPQRNLCVGVPAAHGMPIAETVDHSCCEVLPTATGSDCHPPKPKEREKLPQNHAQHLSQQPAPRHQPWDTPRGPPAQPRWRSA